MDEQGYVIVDKETGLYFARNCSERYTVNLWQAPKYQEKKYAQRMLDMIKRSPATYKNAKTENLSLQLCNLKGLKEKTPEEQLSREQEEELQAFMQEIGRGTAYDKISDFCKNPLFIEPLRKMLLEKIKHDTDVTIDLLHVIELTPYSQDLSAKLVKFERNQRLDRRKYKDALSLLELLYPKGAVTTTEERMRQYVKRVVKIQTERRVYVVRTQEVSKSFSSLFKEEGGMMYLAMRRPLPSKTAGLNWLTETRRKVSQLL